MTFDLAICTDEVFEKLHLPAALRGDVKKNPVGRDLVFDLESRSAVIPHPFSHVDYPDRCLSFFVDGRHFWAWEFVRRSDGPDRYEIFLARSEREDVAARISSLFRSAAAVLDWDQPESLPVLVRRTSQ